jgi:nucleoid-associated protein YejK
MIIAHAVLEILDLRNSQYVYSDSELDFTKDLTNEYVTKIIEKIKKNASKREGEFRETSELRKTLQTFTQDTNFTDFAKIISQQFVEALKKSETYISSDLLVVEYRENNEDNLAFVFLDNEQAITHIMY